MHVNIRVNLNEPVAHETVARLVSDGLARLPDESKVLFASTEGGGITFDIETGRPLDDPILGVVDPPNPICRICRVNPTRRLSYGLCEGCLGSV